MSGQYEQQRTRTNQAAVKVLEFFAGHSRLAFHRSNAIRTVTEMERAIPGDDFRTWGQRLVEAGESLDLRIRSTDLTTHDAIGLASEGIPVVACFTDSHHDGSESVHWLALVKVKRGKVQIADYTDGTESWVTPRQLRKRLGETQAKRDIRWVCGQPAFPCTFESTGLTTPSRRIRPLERLLALIRLDRSDIGAVCIFSIVVGILALATPIAVEALVNTVAFGRYLQPIVVLSGILFGFLGFAAAIRALNTYIVEIIQRRLFVRVVEDLAYRLPRVEQEALDGYYAPELVNRFFDVVTVQKAAVKLLLDGISVVLQTLLGMTILAFYHPFLLGLDVVLLMCIAFIAFGLGRGAVKTAISESEAKYKVAAWLEELARHPTAFKLHGGAQFGLDRSDKLAVDYIVARKSHFRVVMRQIIFVFGLQAVAATVLLGVGGWLVVSGELTLGQLVAAEMIVMIIVGSFAKIGKYLESFYDMMASVDKLGKLFDLPVERHDKLFHLQDATAAQIEIHDVHQSLGGTNLHQGLSFRLEPGDNLAVVGDAGVGKSALLDLITGVRHPSRGYVALDSIDLRELRPDSLREHVSLARDIEIFHGSIDENVHLNRPQINASDVREALDAVGLLNEIMELPEGLSTEVQTNGGPLTTSQACRLMIARAIVGRPRLLMIDGTLDRLSDQCLQTVLEHISAKPQPWTLMIATGREAVISAMHRVLDLNTNQLREQVHQRQSI